MPEARLPADMPASMTHIKYSPVTVPLIRGGTASGTIESKLLAKLPMSRLLTTKVVQKMRESAGAKV